MNRLSLPQIVSASSVVSSSIPVLSRSIEEEAGWDTCLNNLVIAAGRLDTTRFHEDTPPHDALVAHYYQCRLAVAEFIETYVEKRLRIPS